MIKQKPSTDLILACEKKIAELYPFKEGYGEATLQRLFDDLDQINVDTIVACLEAFFRVLRLFELNLSIRLIKDRDKAKLKDLAENCLRYCSILPITSLHSYLYSRLYQLLSENSLESTLAWESFTQTIVGEYLGRDSRSQEACDLLLRAKQAWALGHLRIANITLHSIEMQTLAHDERKWEVFRLMCRVYRVSGQYQLLQDCLVIMTNDFAGDASRLIETEFEGQLGNAHDSQKFLSFMTVNRHKLSPCSLLLGQLWLYTSRNRDLRKNVVLLNKGKGRPKPMGLGGFEAGMARLLNCLEELYDQEIGLQLRLENLGRMLGEMEKLADPEVKLVFLAGATRWLNRIKQSYFAAVLIDEYKALSTRYSEGKSFDTLSLLEDVRENVPVAFDKETAKAVRHLYTGLTPRILTISRLAARATSLYLRIKFRSYDADTLQREKERVIEEYLADAKTAFGRLKGPFMKVGQLLSISSALTDRQREIMLQIFEDAPAVPFPEMKNQLETSLDRKIEDVFRLFIIEPIAVASIGEVFRAILHDGRQVAVKIMYPDIEKIIKSDAIVFNLFRPLLSHFFIHDAWPSFISGLTESYENECDYRNEAAIQAEENRSFAGESEIQIPLVYSEFCSKHVLVTEFIEGQRIDEYLRFANQEQRNILAKRMFRYWNLAMMKSGILHTDPHVANLFMTPEALYIIDYGSVIHISPKDRDLYKTFNICRYKGDIEGLYQVLVNLNLFDPRFMPKSSFIDSLGPKICLPFNIDEVRPFLASPEENVLKLFFGEKHELKIFGPSFVQVSTFLVWQVSVELNLFIGGELNWHRCMGELLVELGVLPASELTIPSYHADPSKAIV